MRNSETTKSVNAHGAYRYQDLDNFYLTPAGDTCEQCANENRLLDPPKYRCCSHTHDMIGYRGEATLFLSFPCSHERKPTRTGNVTSVVTRARDVLTGCSTQQPPPYPLPQAKTNDEGTLKASSKPQYLIRISIPGTVSHEVASGKLANHLQMP
ncbi:hypothetical protein PoB_001404900 [Plakobranchus ocellatus]|uniref:Uncharacterized protein n=1 Tax=Plakobranchus ocellatus TaxID=259542 RepID=A0AAV3YZH9_9GAST|nr:hypothetical protein PoB_001404900 [Plakobranchus ocellatus]